MDLTSAIGTLGSDYVNKVTSAMKIGRAHV